MGLSELASDPPADLAKLLSGARDGMGEFHNLCMASVAPDSSLPADSPDGRKQQEVGGLHEIATALLSEPSFRVAVQDFAARYVERTVMQGFLQRLSLCVQQQSMLRVQSDKNTSVLGQNQRRVKECADSLKELTEDRKEAGRQTERKLRRLDERLSDVTTQMGYLQDDVAQLRVLISRIPVHQPWQMSQDGPTADLPPRAASVASPRRDSTPQWKSPEGSPTRNSFRQRSTPNKPGPERRVSLHSATTPQLEPITIVRDPSSCTDSDSPQKLESSRLESSRRESSSGKHVTFMARKCGAAMGVAALAMAEMRTTATPTSPVSFQQTESAADEIVSPRTAGTAPVEDRAIPGSPKHAKESVSGSDSSPSSWQLPHSAQQSGVTIPVTRPTSGLTRLRSGDRSGQMSFEMPEEPRSDAGVRAVQMKAMAMVMSQSGTEMRKRYFEKLFQLVARKSRTPAVSEIVMYAPPVALRSVSDIPDADIAGLDGKSINDSGERVSPHEHGTLAESVVIPPTRKTSSVMVPQMVSVTTEDLPMAQSEASGFKHYSSWPSTRSRRSTGFASSPYFGSPLSPQRERSESLSYPAVARKASVLSIAEDSGYRRGLRGLDVQSPSRLAAAMRSGGISDPGDIGLTTVRDRTRSCRVAAERVPLCGSGRKYRSAIDVLGEANDAESSRAESERSAVEDTV